MALRRGLRYSGLYIFLIDRKKGGGVIVENMFNNNELNKTLMDININLGMIARTFFAMESLKMGIISENQYRELLKNESNMMFNYYGGNDNENRKNSSNN